MYKEYQHALFGKEVLDLIKENVELAIGEETIFELADLAVKHKLLEYVSYDRKKHGDEIGEYAEEGDKIYYWR